MTFELIPNISLIIAVAGVIALVGRRMPEAQKVLSENSHAQSAPLPELTASSTLLDLTHRTWARFVFWVRRMWHFVLEAKDIRKPGAAQYRLRKMLPHKKAKPVASLEVTKEQKTEQYYLERIKQEPKDLEHYNQLGKLYLDAKRFSEAADIFDFLIKRDPGNAVYYARLGFASYKLGKPEDAVANYERSLALDSAQPNRYYNLSLSLDALGKSEEALVPIGKALELEPQNKKYLEFRNTLHRKLGLQEKV